MFVYHLLQVSYMKLIQSDEGRTLKEEWLLWKYDNVPSMREVFFFIKNEIKEAMTTPIEMGILIRN